ncbi:MAG: L-seryl-tRNA(Sec) selenium transferase [Dehalococcoidales bacterium]|nr:L-seryl-tRNA(Sec) selenium transferase [Dehalococcoidales bacterium]
MENELRRLPSVDKVLSDPQIKALEKDYPHDLLLNLARQQLERERQSILAGKKSSAADEIAGAVRQQLLALEKPGLRPVINATGVVLHTNLGRAPLSEETIAAMDTVSRGYCNLEFNLDTGARGSRHVHIESLLRQLTGAEAAMVVNNNAAAVLLGLMALARRKEVIVSRGQAVEIGGGFRIPDVMRQSGAKLVEVGTTNCTYIADYEQAITPRTAALLRVHSSNFKVVGFTTEVNIEEMVASGNRNNLPVFDDLGSGCFLDTTRFGLGPEPMVQRSVAAGCGLIFFSGDKLVGGPQAGIIVGKKELVDKLKRHPLARAVRIDKVRLAGLAATLIHYLKGEAEAKVPVWRMIAMPVGEIERRAQIWADAVGKLARVVPGESMVGGGSLPGGTLPTRLVAIGGEGKKANIAQLIAGKLRSQPVPIIGRIRENMLLIDPRSVLPQEDEVVLQALKDLAAESG